MKSKKAFTLSVNFLIMMIIMIVLFGFGIYLFTTVFNESVKMHDQVTETEIERMNKLLDNGDLVTVLNPQQTAGKDALRFPIGITNENGNAANKFNITIDSCKFIYGDGPPDDNCLNDDVYQLASDTGTGFDIKNNERKYRLLLVTPQHHGGFYTIVLHVERKNNGWSNYGKKQMIWVTVP